MPKATRNDSAHPPTTASVIRAPPRAARGSPRAQQQAGIDQLHPEYLARARSTRAEPAISPPTALQRATNLTRAHSLRYEALFTPSKSPRNVRLKARRALKAPDPRRPHSGPMRCSQREEGTPGRLGNGDGRGALCRPATNRKGSGSRPEEQNHAIAIFPAQLGKCPNPKRRHSGPMHLGARQPSP